MVEAGYAWRYKYYCGDNKTLEKYQVNAKKQKLGLWADANPVNPYEWRRRNLNVISFLLILWITSL